MTIDSESLEQRPRPGRPPSTSRKAVGHIALELFQSRGFDATTMEDIAAAAGIGRRTLFRYYPSKNDIVWGDFDAVLDRLREELEGSPSDEAVGAVLRRAVVSSNSYPEEELEELRIRMNLITTVPALQGHSMRRYQAWRQVVADFVAARRSLAPDDLEAQVISYAALGTAIAAFTVWVHEPESSHEELIDQGFASLKLG